MSNLPDELVDKRERLLDRLRGFGSCVVAFSAGVDSAVVAKAAHVALGDAAVAVTGTSDSLASGELDEAGRVAAEIGIRHRILATGEFSSPLYVANAPNRCFHCKDELYTELAAVADELGLAAIVNGANLDDRGDHRPGMQAAEKHRVDSPLMECGITKAEVRQLAADWELSVWDKPAMPCLSSRIAYGEEVTPERTRMIDAAERFLRELGLRNVRVRYHRGDLARVEVPTEAITRLADDAVRLRLVEHLKSLGFAYVTLDLEGFRSGSLNVLVRPEDLRILSK